LLGTAPAPNEEEIDGRASAATEAFIRLHAAAR
jgi:hypothetical protein